MSNKEGGKLFDERWLEFKKDPFDVLFTNLPGLQGNAEVLDLKRWYEDRVNATPPLIRSETNLTDGKDWSYESAIPDASGEAQIVSVSRADGNFYSFVGMRVEKASSGFTWSQPVKKASEKELTLQLAGEVRTLPFNGILAVIPDDQHRLLMIAEQEATPETPSQLVVRLPVQASAGKVALMMGDADHEPNPNADKALSQLLDVYGVSIYELLGMAEVKILPPVEDTNHDIKHNLLLVLPEVPSESDLHSKLEDGGKRKWLTKVQQSALGQAGITNSHTLASLELYGSFTFLKDLMSE